MERIEEKGLNEQAELNKKEAAQAPDKSEYMQRILSLSPEDQAFLDGYLFAKVTSRPA